MVRSTPPRALGFAFTRGHTVGPNDTLHPYTLIRIPYWFPTIPLLIIIAQSIWILLRNIRRRHLGLCRKCAYDLRETPTGICPECGASNSRIQTSNESPSRG